MARIYRIGDRALPRPKQNQDAFDVAASWLNQKMGELTLIAVALWLFVSFLVGLWVTTSYILVWIFTPCTPSP